MNRDDLWITALIRALNDRDPRSSLRDLFDRIGALAPERRLSPDFSRFLNLMAAVERHYLNRTWQPVTEAASQMVVERFLSSRGADASSDTGRSSPWQAEYQQLAAEIAETVHRPEVLELMVLGDEQVLGCFPVTPTLFTHSFSGIQSGHYELRTDTGWRLWACELKDTDLILSALRPRRSLRLAAQSRSTTPKPTKRVLLQPTSLLVSVYPGVESGLISIQRRAAGGKGRTP